MQSKLHYLYFQAVSIAFIALAVINFAGVQSSGDIPWD
jgi:hypothetical protein